MWLIVVVIVGLALLVFGLWRIADYFPPRYRRDSLGEIRQAVDHRFGRFGGSYEQDTEGLQDVRHVGRNDPCPCGSGRKYKRCCGISRG
jgi:SEC-C motif-containing protein